jgi:hypothetical protein
MYFANGISDADCSLNTFQNHALVAAIAFKKMPVAPGDQACGQDVI